MVPLPGVAKLTFAGVGLQVLHELGKVVGRHQLGVDHDHAGRLDDLGHADEVVDGVIGQLLEHGGVHAMGGQRGNAEGHAVGGTCHFGHADGAAGAGLVLDHHRLAAQQLGQHVLHVARDHVGGATSRERNDDAQGTGGFLGEGHSRNDRRSGDGSKEMASLHRIFLKNKVRLKEICSQKSKYCAC
jgi:hypothetical protein